MASVVSDPNGRKRLLFISVGGKRRAIRMGRASMKQAETFKARIEQLVSADILGHALDNETSRWLAGLDDKLYGRLAAVGLVKERESMTLGPWLDKYLAGRDDLKPKSRAALEDTRDELVAYWGKTATLRSITPNDAAEWRQQLASSGLSAASVKHHVGNAKDLFREALRRGLITENPMQFLAGGTTAAKNDRYVTPQEADAILDACPSDQWRLLFALARYAGLRTPSETHALTWADVDWHKARLNVRSPKTEHQEGHERRTVPIVPRVVALLQTAFDAATEGEERIVTLGLGGYVRKTMLGIIRRAGVETWPRLWQALRSSCEKQRAMTFPQYAVSRWIGHSIAVSDRHYADAVPDELFAKAAEGGGRRHRTGGAKSGAASGGIASHRSARAGRCHHRCHT